MPLLDFLINHQLLNFWLICIENGKKKLAVPPASIHMDNPDIKALLHNWLQDAKAVSFSVNK
jgi:hypothetical protein